MSKLLSDPIDHGEPIGANELGGKSTILPVRYDQFTPYAFRAVANTIRYGGEKYGYNNHLLISPYDHINHSIGHIFGSNLDQPSGFLETGDINDLIHYTCRANMALENYHNILVGIGPDKVAAMIKKDPNFLKNKTIGEIYQALRASNKK